MYEISNYSNKVRNTQTNEIFIQDDNNLFYQEFRLWKIAGGEPLLISFFASEELEEKEKKAIDIDLYYTNEIGKLLIKHQNKFMEAFALGQTYIIPQVTLDEVQNLKNECNAKIAELGITDYSYRQNNPILAKGEIKL